MVVLQSNQAWNYNTNRKQDVQNLLLYATLNFQVVYFENEKIF